MSAKPPYPMFPVSDRFVSTQVKSKGKEGREVRALTVQWPPSVRLVLVTDRLAKKAKKNTVVENHRAQVKCQFQLGGPRHSETSVVAFVGENLFCPKAFT